ncbi:TonB-dependent receptor [Tenacibaculum finnmarkense]|uniref:TonB-dependent receptor n=1 Tax=Tenacibaculum finnmarkense TaxID=2781243 RepID=UPI001E46C2D8|nr:carboxypeptidase-like regulatory domain-containing protein [Tenacibaculum finnmarkense]MCD8402402.1 carboxypeptidase-like regulatory domain-containing protein [Tenacibaculum finnmarkense genomovar finnmarkense]
MKKIKNVLLVALFFVAATVLGQIQLTGKVVDEMGEPLPGAGLIVKGTANGTATDFDGNFKLSAKSKSGVVVVSFIGYVNQKIAYTASKGNLGTIKLAPSNVLNEIVITATSFAVGRKTPVAVSTLKAADIQAKLGTQEFPEVLKSTPGVYVTKTGGGYGDSRINLRGFASANVAVMINGVPINDMESGKVYWSNWAGLSDVTAAMQVQRGLGASKVAVPSIGGTINIITKSTDVKKGGSINSSVANDGYLKYGMTLSTGLTDNGLAVTASLNKMSGDGYVDGTQFKGFNYFLNISKRINAKHKVSFTGFGAKQEHGQRYNRKSIKFNRNTEQGGRRFNPDWGYRNGKIENSSYNFYHKPQLSLNHDWTISEKAFVTTALYASVASGGGRRTQGDAFSASQLDNYRLGGVDQPIGYDKIVQENIANGVNGASNVFTSSMNDHKWYGVLSTLKYDIDEEFTFSGGLDARYYVGSHYYEVNDLLGGDYWLNNNKALKVGDRFSKDYDGYVKRNGMFTQLEYSNGDLSAFFSSSVSNTNYSKEDNMYGLGMSDNYNFIGFGNKGGVNYNIDEKHNVFGNIGYLSNAPFMNAVFTNSRNNDFNKDAVNEKVFSAELGYGFKSEIFSANLNVYRTSWLDKSVTSSIVDRITDERLYGNFTGLDALHQGVEFDFVYKVTDKLKLTGMASLGDWTWQSDVKGIIENELGTQRYEKEINAKGLKVNDAAQTTYAAGLSYEPIKKTKFFVDYNYAGDIYSKLNISESTDRQDSWKMPNYHLFDLGFRHGFKIGDFNATLNGKLNNILDTEYISDAFDGSNHTAQDATVYYGAGRTFSLGLKVKF